MARINTYDLDQVIRPEDLLVGSSLEGSFNGQPIYKTRNYRLDKMAEFFIGYDFNAGLSLTTLEGRVTINEGDILTLQSSSSSASDKLQYLILSSDSSMFMGVDAGVNDDGTDNSNIGIGVRALNSVTTSPSNIAIGSDSLRLLSTIGNGLSNIAIGVNSGYNLTSSFGNVMMGQSTLNRATNASYNVSIGTFSLFDLTSGGSNVAVGYSAGNSGNVSGVSKSVSNSIFIGSSSVPLSNTSSSREIVIGNNISGDGSNTFKAGNSELQSFRFGELKNNIAAITTDRIVDWPNKSGTIAMIDDVPTTAEKDNWDAAYNENIVNISVTQNASGSVKTITLTKRNGDSIFDDFTDIFESGAGGITDTNNYVNDVTFNASTGVLTIGRLDLPDLTVSTFDDRYYTETEVNNLLSNYVGLTSTQTISGQKTFTTNSPKFDHYISLLEGAPAGSISGYGALTAQSGGILRFLPANEAFAGRLAFPGLTAQRTYTFPDASGTVALTSDLIGIDADTVDGLQATSFYRSDTANTSGTGSIQLSDGFAFSVGDSSDMIIRHSGGNNLIDLSSGNLVIRDVTTNRVTITRTTGDITTTGNISGVTGTFTSGVIPIVVGIPDADSIKTLLPNGTFATSLLTTGSSNYPSGFGQVVIFRGTEATTEGNRDLYLWKSNGDNSEFYIGSTHSVNGAEFFKIWHDSNDGIGSGLDADLLDGLHASSFIRSDADDTVSGIITFVDNNQLRFGDGSDFRFYHSTSPLKNIIASSTADWVFFDLVSSSDRVTIGRASGDITTIGNISLGGDLFLGVTEQIIFGQGTPQEEILSAAVLSSTSYAFNSLASGQTSGSTITFTRLSGDPLQEYSITNIARLNSPNTFTGSLTAPDFILSSDVSLKENIKQYVASPIEINYKTYNLIGDEDKNQRVGVIAQELEQSHPEFVRQDENGVKSVSYIDLLMAKIAELEHRINYLENGGYTG